MVKKKSKWTKEYWAKYMFKYMRKRRKEEIFRKREYQLTKARFKRNPEQMEKQKQYHADWVKRNPDKIKSYYKKYNKNRVN